MGSTCPYGVVILKYPGGYRSALCRVVTAEEAGQAEVNGDHQKGQEGDELKQTYSNNLRRESWQMVNVRRQPGDGQGKPGHRKRPEHEQTLAVVVEGVQQQVAKPGDRAADDNRPVADPFAKTFPLQRQNGKQADQDQVDKQAVAEVLDIVTPTRKRQVRELRQEYEDDQVNEFSAQAGFPGHCQRSNGCPGEYVTDDCHARRNLFRPIQGHLLAALDLSEKGGVPQEAPEQVDRFSIQNYCAGAAIALFAAEFYTGDVQVITE